MTILKPPLQMRHCQSRRRLMIVCAVVACGQILGTLAHRLSSPEIAESNIYATTSLSLAAILGFIAAALHFPIVLVARLTLTVCGVCLLVLLWKHGGIGGFHSSALLMLPAVSSLVLGTRDTVFFSIFCAASIVGLYVFHDALPQYQLSGQEHVAATFRSLMFVTFMIMFSLYLLVRDAETSEERLRTALAEQAYAAKHDALTGLANRAAVAEWVHEVEAKNAAARIFLVDLDGFKAMNDSFGHAVGDAVLKEITERLKALLPKDAMVARLGGDEFFVGVSLTQTDDVDDIGERLANELKITRSNELVKRVVTASVGSSDFPAQAETVSTVMAHADRALYFAKNNGKACSIHFSDECDTKIIAMSDELKRTGSEG